MGIIALSREIVIEKEGKIIAGGNGWSERIYQLSWPIDVIVDEENYSIIIADMGNKRIVRWWNKYEQEILIDNIDCYGLAMDKQGFLYVSNWKKCEVRRWKIGDKSKGTLLAREIGWGDQLNFPTFIFVDDEQSVYVSDSANHRVMKWKKDSKEGTIVAGGNGQENNSNQLSQPAGLFVDRLNDRIMCWCEGEREGKLVVGVNRADDRSNLFSCPEGLAFDLEGNLYIADFGNHRIQKFEIIS